MATTLDFAKSKMARTWPDGRSRWPVNLGCLPSLTSTAMDISTSSTTAAESIEQGNIVHFKRIYCQSPLPDKSYIAKRRQTIAPKPPAVLQIAKPLPACTSKRLSDSSLLSDSYGCDSTSTLRRSRFDELYRYKELRPLGNGGNGNCFLLERQEDKVLRVCKVTHGLPKNGRAKLLREVRVLREILPLNERILRVYEAIQGPRQCQIYFDYYDGGDLSHFIDHYKWYNVLVPESFIWHAFLQLSEALAYLHHGYDHKLGWTQTLSTQWQTVIHADLKPANVFLRLPTKPTEYPSLVLGDFGAAQLQPGSGYIGTFQWMPPEIPAFSCKSDVWSLGAIIHALAHSGLPPMADLPAHIPYTMQNLQRWCCRPDSREVMPLLDYSVELEDCMMEALRWDLVERYTSHEILQSVRYEVDSGVAGEEIWEPLLEGWCKPESGNVGDGTPMIVD